MVQATIWPFKGGLAIQSQERTCEDGQPVPFNGLHVVRETNEDLRQDNYDILESVKLVAYIAILLVPRG